MREYFEKLYKGTQADYLRQLRENLEQEVRTFVVTANPATFMEAERKEAVRALLLDEQTSAVADGIGIVKGAVMLDIEIPERIAGVDLAQKLMEYGSELGSSIFLFGSKQEVLDAMCRVIARDYPGLKLAGAVQGYVTDRDEVFAEIKKAAPDIVLVALGIPTQEVLIHRHLKDFKKGIFVGVGGSLDVLSGSKIRAPQFFINHNLEWLYRILKEPKRIKRFYNSHVKFVFRMRKEKRNKRNEK